jgi:hypothetical protein
LVGIHQHGDNLLGKALEGGESRPYPDKSADDHERPLHLSSLTIDAQRARHPRYGRRQPNIACRGSAAMTLGEFCKRWPPVQTMFKGGCREMKSARNVASQSRRLLLMVAVRRGDGDREAALSSNTRRPFSSKAS